MCGPTAYCGLLVVIQEKLLLARKNRIENCGSNYCLKMDFLAILRACLDLGPGPLGTKANMSHVACKWAPQAINKKVT